MGTRRNSKWTKLELFLVVPLLLMACSLGSVVTGGSQATPTNTVADTPVATTPAPSDTPAPTLVKPIRIAPTVQLPLSFTYANLTITVATAEIILDAAVANGSRFLKEYWSH